MKSLALIAAVFVLGTAAAAQTTSLYLLNDGGALTTFPDLAGLRAEVTARSAAGEFCELEAFRLDVAIVDGVPVTTATPLPIVATGADVVEAVAASADCDETCEAVRAALADPPGSPAAVGEACDCFQILGIPPRRTRVGRHVVTGGKSGNAAGYCSSL